MKPGLTIRSGGVVANWRGDCMSGGMLLLPGGVPGPKGSEPAYREDGALPPPLGGRFIPA